MTRTARIAVIARSDATDALKQLQSTLPPGATIVAYGLLADLIENQAKQLAEANVVLSLLGGYKIGTGIETLWPFVPKLEWLSVVPSGIGPFLQPSLVASDVVLTNGRGTFSSLLAEYAITACLYFAKNIQKLQDNQRRSKWEPLYVEELRGKVMGIIGYGDIGQACAKLAKVFGMEIIAVRRRTHLSKAEADTGLQVFPPEQFHEVLRKSDYVVNALPATPATDKYFDKQALAQLKANAVIINLGRGKSIDEAALIEVLREGKIRGAALDTVEVEPLPESSPLWKLDNVLVSPHCACRTQGMFGSSVQRFIENVERFLNGKELKNVCDKNEGY